MAEITRDDLLAYLEDALSGPETARVEKALRESASLRQLLRTLVQEREAGDHSLGAIWRRHRLSCPTREQLGTYLLGALDEGLRDYIQFHLNTIGCGYCQANLDDLQSQARELPNAATKRRARLFQSSVGLLPTRPREAFKKR
jgi:hypothetical protein